MKLQPKTFPLESILLDPNNYRFMDLKDWRPVREEQRFKEDAVQSRALELLRRTPEFAVALLRDSIVKNGFVPLEQIVVRPFPNDPSTCIVVEGNRRIAAIKWVLQDEQSGILTLDDGIRTTLCNLSVLLLDPSDSENELATEVLMAIRHVSGIKEWGAYQQARLIVRLMELPESTFTSVGERLGMTSREVARRFRASMALRQMEEDTEYQNYAQPEMHGLFQETFASTAVRDWLEWDEDHKVYTNRENLQHFYTWITNTEEHDSKITGAFDVRKLKTILRNEDALALLKDQERSLSDAFNLAEQAGMGSRTQGAFESALKQASDVIEKLPATALRTLSQDQITLLEDLRSRIDEAFEHHRLLQSRGHD